jgi:DNA-binding response OmpR family regulator
MTAPPRILVLEDDEDIAAALARGLDREGYAPVLAHDLAEAEALPDLAGFDAAVIDVMLGPADGRDMVRRLRVCGMAAPIVMLSALSGVEDRAAGLAAGADDYVAKPFDFAELVARIRVQERRRAAAAGPQRLGPLRYDPATRSLAGPRRTAALTEREARLFELFLARPGAVLTRHAIFDTLWADLGGTSENVVDVYVGYLRRKLAALGAPEVTLRTVRGRGFLIALAEPEDPPDA